MAVIGPQSREPSEAPFGEPGSAHDSALARRNVVPQELWLQPDRPPLSVRRAFLFLVVTAAAGLIVLYVVAWLMGF